MRDSADSMDKLGDTDEILERLHWLEVGLKDARWRLHATQREVLDLMGRVGRLEPTVEMHWYEQPNGDWVCQDPTFHYTLRAYGDYVSLDRYAYSTSLHRRVYTLDGEGAFYDLAKAAPNISLIEEVDPDILSITPRGLLEYDEILALAANNVEPVWHGLGHD